MNQLDKEKIAMILAEIHGVSPEEAFLDPGKWLKQNEDDQLIVVPNLKPQLPVNQE